MATPTIKIDGSVSGAGTPGQSRDDLILAETWTFTDPANGAGTYAWTLRERPVGSTATLSGAATPTATLVPDIVGTYLVELLFNGTDRSGSVNAIGEFISTQGGAAIKLSNGTRIPGGGETTQYGTTGWHPAMDSVLRKHDDLAEMDGAAQGSVFYANSSTNPAVLAPGTSGQVLKTQGAAADPIWADFSKSAYASVGWAMGEAVLPTSNPAAAGTRNDHKILAFDDTTTESAIFEAMMPKVYSDGPFKIYLFWVAATATTGDVVWGAEVEHDAPAGHDIDSDSFAGQQTTQETAPGTSGVIKKTTINLTKVQADGVEASNPFRLRIQRVIGAGDTMTGDAQLLRVSLEED